MRRITCALVLALLVAGCGSNEHSTDSTSATTDTTATTGTTKTTTVKHVTKPVTDTATPKNVTITPADRAALLATANEWKRTHEDGWGDGTTFAGSDLTGPVKGGVYDARWGGHEYAYARFDLPKYEAESALLFAREEASDDWSVVRLDTNTDIGGICGLPTPLATLWFADIARHDGCQPMGDARGTVTDAALSKDPFLLTSTDRTVTCLFADAANGTETATCANDVDGSGLRLTGTGTDPAADPRSSTRLFDAFFAEAHARGAALGLDETRVVGRFSCSSPGGAALECANSAGGRIHVDGGV